MALYSPAPTVARYFNQERERKSARERASQAPPPAYEYRQHPVPSLMENLDVKVIAVITREVERRGTREACLFRVAQNRGGTRVKFDTEQRLVRKSESGPLCPGSCRKRAANMMKAS